MNRPTTAREALIVEAIGDVSRLLDRIESLTPAMEGARQALVQAHAELGHRVLAFESRMSAITENAKTKAVEYIARRTDEVARRSIEDQTRSMTEAARALFNTEVGPTLHQLASSLQRLVDRVNRPWELWLTHAATAAVSSAVTSALAVYLMHAT